MIQFLSAESMPDSKKERLTNDVRYQKFNEVTLDLFRVTPESVKGHFLFWRVQKKGLLQNLRFAAVSSLCKIQFFADEPVHQEIAANGKGDSQNAGGGQKVR